MKYTFFMLVLCCLLFPSTAQIEYPFESFDNDATRLNSYFNLFGGNWGIMNAEPDHPYVSGGWGVVDGYSTDTRTGKGRCLRLNYNYTSEDVSWGGGIWSSLKLHVDSLNQTINFTNLFEDLDNSVLGTARIDSIAFWAKLENVEGVSTYTIDFEIRDYRNLFEFQAKRSVDLFADDQWHRYAIAFSDFDNWSAVDSTRVKKISIILQAEFNNESPSGSLLLDDIVFVDKDRVIPDLSDDEVFLEYINLLNFKYFLEYSDTYNFALDRSNFGDLVSVAAIGFQLTALCIADKNEWMPDGAAEYQVKEILSNLWSAPHGTKQDCLDNKFGYATCEGLWYHFLQSGTLKRIQPVDSEGVPTELSLFDTGLLMAGVLSARQYFEDNPLIVDLADSLYLNVDWSFLLEEDPGALHFGRLYIGWAPETGFTPWAMDYFTEEDILVNLLSLCSPTHPVPLSTFQKVFRDSEEYAGVEVVKSAPGALFTYFFAQLWCNFPDSLDGHQDIPMNYFSNTQNAMLANKAFCEEQYADFPWWNDQLFGLTACEGPDSSFCLGPGVTNYHAYGAEPTLDEVDHNGTFAVYGAGSSIVHLPETSIQALRYYADSIPELFNHLFGYYDAFHLDPDQYPDSCLHLDYNGPWISSSIFGIDVGPMLIMIDNYLSELNAEPSIRDYFTSNPYISCSMDQIYGYVVGEDYPIVRDEKWLGIHAFPNPSTHKTSFFFQLPSPGNVEILIFDVTGKLVYLDNQQNRIKGVNEYNMDVSQWEGGTYLFQLKVDSTSGEQYSEMIWFVVL